MPSIHPNYEYDIFISYRHNDNLPGQAGLNGWVSNFVEALQNELKSTVKNEVSIYFDKNPHDGLLETHSVDESLAKKLKCLIFIPIISQTYCDESSFAWEHEFMPFINMAVADELGINIMLRNGNVASRVLPVQIHELENEDENLLESIIGPLRSIKFIYQNGGVNRPLQVKDSDLADNQNKTNYRNQINKVANACKDIGISILRKSAVADTDPKPETKLPEQKTKPKRAVLISLAAAMLLILGYWGYSYFLGSASGFTKKDKSIAVLYFDNMSGDPEQEYFSDGITEEIIARLTKINGLRVISRTSTRVYKGQPLNLKKIANELNVSAVLEGSYRRSGNQIKVTAQFIDAATDEHIWAETFDIELKDIFQVQTEIAHQVAEKMKVDIAPEINLVISEIPTENFEAYEYFLRGKHISMTQYYQLHDSSAFVRAKLMYEKAINLDPQFAEPYAGLGDLYDERRNSNKEEFPDEMDSLRHALSDKAYSLSPNSSWVNNTRAWTFLNRSREEIELDSGFYFLKRAWELDPNDAYYLGSIAGFYRVYLGLYDESEILLEKAIDLNPLDPSFYHDKALAAGLEGNLEEWYKFSITENELRGELNDEVNFFYNLYVGNYEECEKYFIKLEPDDELSEIRKVYILLMNGEKEKARRIIKEKNIDDITLFAAAGMRDEVIEFASSRKFWMNYHHLKNHYVYDAYRQDTVFQEIIAGYKIQHEEKLKKYGPYVAKFMDTAN